MPSMRRWRRSAFPWPRARRAHPMPWPAERRSPSLRRCARRCDTLAASVDTVPFERFSALLRAPELQASAAEAGSRGALGRAAAQAGTQRGGSRGLAGAGGANRGRARHRPRRRAGSPAAARCGRSTRCAAVIPSAAGYRPGSPPSKRVPGRCGSAGRAPNIRRRSDFANCLGKLATADSLFGTHPARSAQRILRRAARDTAFQVQTGVPPIWVSGQLIDPWLNYDGLWVSGCNDERWPPAVDPIPCCP